MHSSNVSETSRETNLIFRNCMMNVQESSIMPTIHFPGVQKKKNYEYVYILFKDMAIIQMGKILTVDGSR